MELLETLVYFWQNSSVLPYTCDWEVCRVEVVMGPIQTRVGVFLMPSPVAGMGEVQELPWVGRWGFAAAAQLPGTRQLRAECFS